MRTVHGILISTMTDHEKDRWLARYTELLVDAKKRGDRSAEDMYKQEVRKLLQP